MPAVRAQRRTTGLEAMSKSLGKVLDTISEIKQHRGRQQLNAAVMEAISQPGTPDERRTAATDAASGVRNQQGSSGILGGIMSAFDPRVPTFVGTAPIEELLTGTMVRDLTSRSSYESAQLIARNRNQQMLISAQNQLSKLQGDLSEYVSGAEVSEEGVNPERAKSFGTQIDFWQNRVQGMLQQFQQAQPQGVVGTPRAAGEIDLATQALIEEVQAQSDAAIQGDIRVLPSTQGTVAGQPPATAASPQTARDIHAEVDSGLLEEVDFLMGREGASATQNERVNALLTDLEIDVEGLKALWGTRQADVGEVLKALDNGTLSRDGAVAVLKKLQEQ